MNGHSVYTSITKINGFLEIPKCGIKIYSMFFINSFYFFDMSILSKTPKKLPLNIILIGTSLLAIPAAFGTYALIEDPFLTDFKVENFTGKELFLISICGFLLFAGYILTAVFQKHSRIFWFCSAIYNLCISTFYVLVAIYGLFFADKFTSGNIIVWIFSPAVLLPFWTIFVTISSFYYFKFVLQATKTKLP